MNANPPVHLVNRPVPTRSSCGVIVPILWSRDVQAVTCPDCVARIELQAA